MSKITAIRTRGRATDRFVVEVDEESFATVGFEQIERFSLHVGDELDDASRAGLLDASLVLAAYDRGVRMLASRGRAREDLKRKLIEKKALATHATQAVERLAAQGLLDDGAFARQYVRSRALSQGRRRLSFDLSRQGVAKDVAAKAIDEVLGDPTVDARESLDRLAEKRMRALAKYEPAVQKRRLLGFLSRRGYGSQEIQAAMARVGVGGRS